MPTCDSHRYPRRRFAACLHRAFAALRRDEDGAIAVEWALVAGFLGFLFLGAFNYGVAALHKMEMANAVRAGLQYAVVRKPIQGDTSQINNTVQTAAPKDNTGTRSIAVTMFCQCSDGSSATCSGTCSSGDPQTYIAIVMQEGYDTLINLPFSDQRMNFKVEGRVRLN
ncbi:MAG: pilus assembly protein [Alphaproteobacteria bacterium]|nr:pilus assembly protein [Alphaproteobacteria bacterium]